MTAVKKTYNQIQNQVRGNLTHQECVMPLVYGFLVMLFAWLTQYLLYADYSFNLFTLHKQNIFLLLFDVAPVFALFICNKLYSFKLVKTQLELENAKKDDLFNQYAQVASQIQKGDFSFSESNLDVSNPMGQTLLKIQDDQKKNKIKDDIEDWRTKGKDIVTDILRKNNDLTQLANELIVALVKYSDMIQGSFYIFNEEQDQFETLATYAYNRQKVLHKNFKKGYGLIGQAAYEQQTICRYEIPESYATITSGILGDTKPCSLLILPLIADQKVQGVIEMASFKPSFTFEEISLNERVCGMIAQSIFILKANTKTQMLLKDSQKLTNELRLNQQELIEKSLQIQSVNELLEDSNKSLEIHVEEIKNSEQKIQAILEQATEVISIYNIDKKLIYETASVKHILGMAPATLANKEGISFIHEQATRVIKELIDQLIRTPYKSQTIEFKMVRKDGVNIWLESTGRNLIDNPAIQGIIITSRDITIFKMAEQEHRMKGQMQALSENSPDMIVRLSPNKKIFYANPMFEEYTGLKIRTSLNKKIIDLPMEPTCAELMAKSVDTVMLSKVRVKQEHSIKLGNELRILMTNAMPETNEEHDIESVLLVAHDITERKRFELEIQEKNKKISDSINYAKRLQTSIMPTTEVLQQHFVRSFMFYKPRDVVSGDFPWILKYKEFVWVAAVDCTGHGVPGALLSLIGHFHLTAIVEQYPELHAAAVLNRLHLAVRHTLKQDVYGAESRDGMDIALCKINTISLEMEFAGAHRPLLHLHKQELEEYKGDRKAIGGIPLANKKEKDFTNYVIPLQTGDRIFFFSDGLPDQEGGIENKKYSAKRIRELIKDNYDLTIGEVSRMFAEDLDTWKGNVKQLDDILLIGIEF